MRIAEIRRPGFDLSPRGGVSPLSFTISPWRRLWLAQIRRNVDGAGRTRRDRRRQAHELPTFQAESDVPFNEFPENHLLVLKERGTRAKFLSHQRGSSTVVDQPHQGLFDFF